MLKKIFLTFTIFGKTYYFCLPDSTSNIVAGFTVANASIFTKRLPNARQKNSHRLLPTKGAFAVETPINKGLSRFPDLPWHFPSDLPSDLPSKGGDGNELF